MIEMVIVLACVVGVGWWVIRTVLGIRGGILPRGSGVVPTTTWAAFAIGFTTVVGLQEMVSAGVNGVVTLAFGIGAISAMTRWNAWISGVGQWGMTAIGLVGSIPVARDLLTGQSQCPGAVGPIGQGASGVLMLGLFALSMFAGIVLASRTVRPAFGVALFGSLTVIQYLASPLGYSLIGNSPGFLALSIVGACVMGGATAVYPESMAAIAMLLTVFVWFSGQVGVVCGAAPTAWSDSVAIVAPFAVAFLLTVVLGNLFRRSRT